MYKPQDVALKLSKPKADEKPIQTPSKIKTAPPQNQEQELFRSSVTKGAAPSPRRVPVAMFNVREWINLSSL